MIQLVIYYIIILVCFVTFLATGWKLRDRVNSDVTKWDKFLNSLNIVSLVMSFLYTLFFLLTFIPLSGLARFDDFVRDVFSNNIAILTIPIILLFLSGYWIDPRANKVLTSTVNSIWYLILGLLIILAGILGIYTGILL